MHGGAKFRLLLHVAYVKCDRMKAAIVTGSGEGGEETDVKTKAKVLGASVCKCFFFGGGGVVFFLEVHRL